ncbi:Potassium-transporting ATPase C chain [Aquicella siphonis]|uniref:Potassium-transporting ATPase C chain n=1 Tax=Aquicella siphonis TaxID=254247 RepID=A0A5E4PLM5_9COXI|nr:Potassium-transporting ATPase C chain [Aquicella siphonis]
MIVMTILTGMIYPLAVAGLAYLFFPWQSGGSLIAERGRIIGSALIGQVFTDPRYFWGRPSATEPFPYNTAFSNGSNLGPGNPQLLEAVKARVQRLRQFDPGNQSLVPVDLVTTSGSGLDPDISPLAAYYQVHRVALARNLPDGMVQQLV